MYTSRWKSFQSSAMTMPRRIGAPKWLFTMYYVCTPAHIHARAYAGAARSLACGLHSVYRERILKAAAEQEEGERAGAGGKNNTAKLVDKLEKVFDKVSVGSYPSTDTSVRVYGRMYVCVRMCARLSLRVYASVPWCPSSSFVHICTHVCVCVFGCVSGEKRVGAGERSSRWDFDIYKAWM